MTDADRATLANILERVQEIDAALWSVRAIVERVGDPADLAKEQRIWHHVVNAQMGVHYIEGRIRGLLAEPIPAREGE